MMMVFLVIVGDSKRSPLLSSVRSTAEQSKLYYPPLLPRASLLPCLPACLIMLLAMYGVIYWAVYGWAIFVAVDVIEVV